MITSTAQRDAIQLARQVLQQRPVYLDTETTGTGPTAEVIEVGVVDSQGQVVRVVSGKNIGQSGRLSQIHPGVHTFPSGLTTTAADIQLEDGTEICVPVANLDVLE